MTIISLLPTILPGVDLDTIASIILYGLGIGFPILMCGLPMCCWWWRSQTWKMRDCWCFKRLMRGTGVDGFDDFEAIISVHEAHHQNKSNVSTSVRVTAGSFDVETDASNHSNYQQSFVLFVEQGTEYIYVELIDSYKRKMATLKLDPIRDIFSHPNGVSQKTYTMKAKKKDVGNARLILSIKMEKPGDEEKGLLGRPWGKHQPPEVEFMLDEQLKKHGWEEGAPPKEQLHALAASCTGPVDHFTYFGVTVPGMLAMLGPPQRRRWTLGFWKEPHDYSRPGDLEVDLMHISSVVEDPGRSEVFVVSYADTNRVESRVLFRRTDRARDVWVSLLGLHISAVREMKDARAQTSASFKKESPSIRDGPRPTLASSSGSMRRGASENRAPRSSRVGPTGSMRRAHSERREMSPSMSHRQRGSMRDASPPKGASGSRMTVSATQRGRR